MISHISIGSKVICANGEGGKSTAVIVDPVSRNLTHIAVAESSILGGEERLVPVDQVANTTRDAVYLKCNTDDIQKMEAFTRTHYLETPYGEEGYAYSQPYMSMTYDTMASPGLGYITVQDRLVPEGGVALHRGMLVETRDGLIGQVGELLIDPKSGQITHFLLMKGHGWGKKEIAIQVSSIDRIEEETIHLKIEKSRIDELPSLPVKRNWDEVVATDLELMVWVFDREGLADQALDKVHELSTKYKLEILNATVLKKNTRGEVHVHEQKKIPSRRKVTLGLALGGLAGLMIGPVALVAGAIAGATAGKKSARKVEVGFSQDKLRKLDEYLVPGGSALVVLVEHRWFTTLQLELVESGGKLFHERLSDITYDELVEKLSAEETDS